MEKSKYEAVLPVPPLISRSLGYMRYNTMNPNDDKDLDKVQRTHKQAILQRKHTIEVLTDAINQIRTVARDTNIAKLVGNSSSFVGTGVLLVGLFLAPFTSGMSLLVCSLPGGTLSFLGSVTTVGASIAYTLKESELLKLAKSAFQKDKDTMTKHKETIEDFMTENGSAEQMKQWVTNLNKIPNATVVLSACKGFSADDTAAISNTTADATGGSVIVKVTEQAIGAKKCIETGIQTATGKTSLRALVGTDKVLAMSKSTLKITLPLAIAFMTFDMYTIIQTSIDMKTGNTSLNCGKLKQMCKLLEFELKNMEEELKQF